MNNAICLVRYFVVLCVFVLLNTAFPNRHSWNSTNFKKVSSLTRTQQKIFGTTMSQNLENTGMNEAQKQQQRQFEAQQHYNQAQDPNRPVGERIEQGAKGVADDIRAAEHGLQKEEFQTPEEQARYEEQQKKFHQNQAAQHYNKAKDPNRPYIERIEEGARGVVDDARAVAHGLQSDYHTTPEQRTKEQLERAAEAERLQNTYNAEYAQHVAKAYDPNLPWTERAKEGFQGIMSGAMGALHGAIKTFETPSG